MLKFVNFIIIIILFSCMQYSMKDIKHKKTFVNWNIIKA